MTRWHNQYEDGIAQFCTATVNGWQPRLDHPTVAVLYQEWESARKAFGVSVLAFIIMPDHIHLILWSESGEMVKRFMQRVLSRSSKRIGRGGKFWKERLRAVPLYSPKVLRVKLDYIHANPVKAGLVSTQDEWPHSSFLQLETGSSSTGFKCDSWPEGALFS